MLNLNLYGQSHIIDSNCSDIAKSSGYFKGNSSSFNTRNNNGKSWLDWGKFTGDFHSLAKSKDIQELASRRSKNTNPHNPMPSVVACGKASRFENCTGFKAYCANEIATKALLHESNYWKGLSTKCREENFYKSNSKTCEQNIDKNISHLKDQKNKIDKIRDEMNNNIFSLFNEVSDSFSNYENDLSALQLAARDARNGRLTYTKTKEDLKKAKELIKSCDDLVSDEFTNSKASQISNYLSAKLNGSNCEAQEVGVDQGALNSLLKDLQGISLESSADIVAPEVAQEAMKKSAIALASTYDLFWADDKKNFRNPTFVNEMLEEKCQHFTTTTRGKKKYSSCPVELKSAFKDGIAEYLEQTHDNPIKKLDEAGWNKELEKFNSFVPQINNICSKAKDEYSTLSDNTSLWGAGNLGYDNVGVDPQGMENTSGHKYIKKISEIKEKTKEEAQKLYRKMLKTKVGGFMITNDFRENVQALDDGNFTSWVGSRCLAGDGVALKTANYEDIRNGKKDFQSLIDDEISSISKKMSSKGDDKEDLIEDYLRTHPATIAELLNKNTDSDYSKILCAYIYDIGRSDRDRFYLEVGVGVVGAIGGVAAAMTGVGTPAGAALLATSLGLTVADGSMMAENITRDNNAISGFARAGVTGQYSVEETLAGMNESKNSKDLNKAFFVLNAAFGSLDLVTAVKSPLWKHLKYLPEHGGNAGHYDLSQKMTKSLEALNRKKEQFKFFSSIESDPETMVRLAEIASLIDPKDQEAFFLSLSKLENAGELRRFLKAFDENSEKILTHTGKEAEVIDDLVNKSLSVDAEEDILLSSTKNNTGESSSFLKPLNDFDVDPGEIRSTWDGIGESQFPNIDAIFKESGDDYYDSLGEFLSKIDDPFKRSSFLKQLNELESGEAIHRVLDDLYHNESKFSGEDMKLILARGKDPDLITNSGKRVIVDGKEATKGSINEFYELIASGDKKSAYALRDQIESNLKEVDLPLDELKLISSNRTVKIYEVKLKDGTTQKLAIKDYGLSGLDDTEQAAMSDTYYKMGKYFNVDSSIPSVTRVIEGKKYGVFPLLENSIEAATHAPDEIKLMDLFMGGADMHVHKIRAEGSDLQKAHNIMTAGHPSGSTIVRIDNDLSIGLGNTGSMVDDLMSKNKALLSKMRDSDIMNKMKNLTDEDIDKLMPRLDVSSRSKIKARRDKILDILKTLE